MVAYCKRSALVWAQMLLLGGILCGLEACASIDGYPTRIGDADQYVTEVNSFVAPSSIVDYNDSVASGAGLNEIATKRNNIVTARIYAIDVNYHKFIRDLTAQQNVGAVGADWIALGLAGAGATTGSAQTKAVLAAISGGVTGARAAVSKDVFYSNTLPTVITQMDAQRKTILAQIYTGLQKSPIEYTLYQALADLENYYNAGTLNGALVGLATSAGASSEAGDKQIAATLAISYSYDTASQALLKFWMPDGKTVNTANAAAIRAWMKANKLNTMSIPALIYGAQYATQRAQAVKDLKL